MNMPYSKIIKSHVKKCMDESNVRTYSYILAVKRIKYNSITSALYNNHVFELEVVYDVTNHKLNDICDVVPGANLYMNKNTNSYSVYSRAYIRCNELQTMLDLIHYCIKNTIAIDTIKYPVNKEARDHILSGRWAVVTTNKNAFDEGYMYTLRLDFKDPNSTLISIDGLKQLCHDPNVRFASPGVYLNNLAEFCKSTKTFHGVKPSYMKLYIKEHNENLKKWLDMYGVDIIKIETVKRVQL